MGLFSSLSGLVGKRRAKHRKGVSEKTRRRMFLENLEARQLMATVNVYATYGPAAEGLAPGRFTFSRSPVDGTELTVNYGIAGTATAGSDYTSPYTGETGTVTFAPWSGMAIVEVAATNDTEPEDTETLIAVVQPGGYDIGSDWWAYNEIPYNDGWVPDAGDPFFNGCRLCGIGGPVTKTKAGPEPVGVENSGGDPGSTQFPIRYFDGAAYVRSTDLESTAFGRSWGVTRDWNNRKGYARHNVVGDGMVIREQPQLVNIGGATNTIAVILDGYTLRYFDNAGSAYVARGFYQDKLYLDSANDEYVLTTIEGDEFRFFGFGSGPLFQKGSFKSLTDAYGNVTSVTSRTIEGRIAEVQRSGTVGDDTVTESFLYTFGTGSTNWGLISSVTLRRNTNGAGWVNERKVEYSYYGGGENHGNQGDLKKAVIKDGSGNVLDTTYYRYYQPSEANGFTHGLKYVFYPESYARIVAEVAADPTTASDSALAPYADHYFEYDSQRRATKEIAQGAGCSACSGGQGSFTFAYTTSTNTDGYNSWKTKTVETLPDGNQNIVYTNYRGQVMLHIFKDTTTFAEWRTFYKFDNQGRVIFRADPSAVSGYTDTSADLMVETGGNYTHVRDSLGLVTTYTYSTATTATGTTAGSAAGYLQSIAIKNGETATSIPQHDCTYFAETVGTKTVFVPGACTVYSGTDGSGAITTTYEYAFVTDTLGVLSQTANLPTGSGDEETVVFDNFGRRQWTKDARGFLHYVEYDAETGGITKTIGDVNTTLDTTFRDLPTGWTTPTGGGLHATTTFEVDGQDRPTKATDPNGNVTYTVYNDTQREARIYPGWNTATNLPTGPTIVVRRDPGRSYVETLTMSATPNLTNGKPNGTEAISNVQSLIRTHQNDAGQDIYTDNYFNLTGLTYSQSATLGTQNTHYYRTTQGFDSRGRHAKTVRADGTIYRTVFDGLGRPVSEWIGTNDTPTSGWWSPTNPAGMVKVKEYLYDNGLVGDSHLTRITDALGHYTVLTNDFRGRVTQTQLPDPDANGDLTPPIYQKTYDNLDRVLTETDALSNVTSYAYNLTTRTVTTTLPDPDGGGPLTSPVYSSTTDAMGNIVSTTDALSNVTTREYDSLNRLKKTTLSDPDSGGPLTSPIYQFSYDAASNLRYETDPLGNVTEHQYDSIHRRKQTILPDPDGAGSQTSPVAAYAYNAAGFLHTITDPLSRVTTNEYDAIGRLKKVTDPDPDAGGPLAAPYTQFGYDAADRQTSVTDPLGNVTQYVFNVYDQLTSRTDPDPDGGGPLTSPVTSFTYTIDGEMLTLTDSVNNTTTWTYDNLDRVITETNQLNKTRTFKHDANSNLIEQLDRNGRKIELIYDKLNRNTAEKWWDGATLVRTLSFTFDANSQLTAASDPGASYAFTFDNIGRLTNETQNLTGLTPTLSYASKYSANGVRTELQAVIGGTADFKNTYLFDNLSRVKGLNQEQTTGGHAVAQKRIDFGYNAASQFTKIDRYADITGFEHVVSSHLSYDGIGRLTKLLHTKGPTAPGSGWGTDALAGYEYVYDAASRITSINSFVDGLTTFTHDNTDQLTGADHTGQTDESYSYDKNGNRTNAGYSTSTNNRLTTDGTYNYTYDDEGNRTRRTKISDGSYEEYTWDHRNRLTKVTFKTSAGVVTKTVDHSYDVFDRWIKRSVDPDGATGSAPIQDSYFSWENEQINLEFNGASASNLSHRFLWNPAAIDQIMADETVTSLTSAGTVLWPLSDHLGTPRDLATYNTTTDDTAVVNHRRFDTFGQLVSETGGSFTIAIGFTGVYFDVHTGYNYHRYRWLDLRTGRWISEDPIGLLAGDGNLARYVGNSVLALVDPSGLEEADPGPTIGAAPPWYESMWNRLQSRWQNHEPLIPDPHKIPDEDESFALYLFGNLYNRTPIGDLINDAAHMAANPVGEACYQAQSTVNGVRNLPALPEAWDKMSDSERHDAILKPLMGTAFGLGASKQGIKLPTAPTKSVPNPGGRLGKPGTRAHVGQVADEMEKRGFEIVNGGNRFPEEYIPGPGGGKKGSAYPDITATKNGRTVRVNTVDTCTDGVTPTAKEARAAAKIRAAKPNDHLILVPKPQAK